MAQSCSLSSPIKMKRRGPELRLIIPGNQQSETSPVPALVKAVARAHEWAERIFSGEISRIEDLAAETGFTIATSAGTQICCPLA